MQIKVDAPAGALAPPKSEGLEAGKQRASRASQRVTTETENSSRGSETSSLEPKVELRIELRILQAQQRRTSEARGEVSAAQEGLSRVDAIVRELIQYAQTARRSEDEGVRDSYEGSFTTIRNAMVQVQIDIQFPGSVLDGALDGVTRDIFLSGSVEGLVSSAPIEAPEVRSDVIFDDLLQSDMPNFGSTQGIDEILDRLYSAKKEVNTLRSAYAEIGSRLDHRSNELEIEAVNKESSATKPKDLDAALDLAGMTRDQMIQQAALSQFAPGLISPTRALALLEE